MPSAGSPDSFVSSPLRDNWYQSSAYYGSSFALITSVNEAGVTSIGPYQLTFPFEVIRRRSWMVVSRPTSNTVANVRRSGRCALNFVEYDRAQIETILKFGYPGQPPQEKMAYNTFPLVDSPTPGRTGPGFPQIIADAFQVFECTLDVERTGQNPILRDSASAHLLLNIDNVLVKQRWLGPIDGSGDAMPRIPLTYGFRGGNSFWFGETQPAYKLSIPDLGARHEVVHYEANRIDDTVRFTLEASQALTGIPRAFLRQVLDGIVRQARARGVSEVTPEFLALLDKERR
jgi:flavin reductase (DIM6/NTAB) family NADH-FMN oxidoreductase RutF